MATAGKNLSSYNKNDIKNTQKFKIGIVVSEWNNKITDALYKGAYNTLIENNNLDAVIAIGSVIQGETKHFDFVCSAVSQGIKDLNIKYNTPVIFCLLTDNTLQQAIDRSGGKHGNKGVECAVAALKMATLR